MGKANDKQIAGKHYKTSIECWDYITANDVGYLDGNAIKYLTRWRKKNGIEDLRKAQHYLEKLLEVEAARSASPSMESAPNRSPVVCERQPVQTRFGFYDAPNGVAAARVVIEAPEHPTDWPFPNYLGTGSSRYPTEDSLNDAVERLCYFRPVDEQVGDSFPVYASNLENMPILRADTDDV